MTTATPERDRAVDVARIAALVVVMFGHCALLLASVDDRGVHVANIEGMRRAVAGLSVRPYGTDGVRVTIGEPEANDRLIAVARAFGPA